MNESQKSKYYCPKPECTELFLKRAEHSLHESALLKFPSQLKSFEFKRKIGQGSYGVVFEVFDNLDKEPKVLKYISIDNSSSVDGNINNLKKLNHQYIIHYFGSGIIGDDFAYVIMELCDTDLGKMMEKKELSTFPQKVKMFKEICKGIHYLHKVIIIFLSFFSIFLKF